MPLETINFFDKKGEGQGGAKKFVPTRDELRTIEEKMRDPKFLELFGEYMQSMQDPETRREEEEYLAQVEREAREGGDYSFEFVFPRPGFVVELLEPSTSYTPQQTGVSSDEAKKNKESEDEEVKQKKRNAKRSNSFRVFVNMCTSEKIDPFREESVGNGGDSNWHVPVSVSKPRTELFADDEDKSKKETKPVVVYDAVFHTKTLQLANQSDRFCCFLVNIAVEHINTGYGDRNGFEFRRLGSRIEALGTPQNQTIRKKNGISPFAPSKDEPVLRGPTKTLPTSSSDDRTNTHTEPSKKVEQKTETKNKTENLPSCTIAHRGRIDLTDAWGWKVVDQRIGVPEELVVRMELPGVRAAADLGIDVEDAYVRIAQSEKHPFHGALTLPFSVEPTPVEAKFERKKGILTIVLRVVPPAPTGFTADDMRQKLTSLAEPNSDTEADPTRNAKTEEEEEHNIRTVNDNEKGEEAKVTAPAPAIVPAPSTNTEAKEDTQSLSAPTLDPPVTPCDLAAMQEKQTEPTHLEPTPEVSCIGDQDRVRVMMEKVQQARRDRERAAAAAAADTAEDTEAGAIRESQAVGEGDVTCKPEDPATDSAAADLQQRQSTWLSDVQQRAEAREAAEREAALQAEREAEREMRREAERARRQAEATKNQEVAEAKLRERMEELPLCNKHIFAID